MNLIGQIKKDRDLVRKQRLKFSKKVNTRMVDVLRGQEIAFNRCLSKLEELFNYVNEWGDMYKNRNRPRLLYMGDKITEFGWGYRAAMEDVYDFLMGSKPKKRRDKK